MKHNSLVFWLLDILCENRHLNFASSRLEQEMEEREKLVGRMCDMYTRTSDEVRLPRFWQEAFEAAYEELAGDDMQVRDAAISEIARMSAHRLELEQPVNANEVRN
jgi:hypothetical protein